MFANATGDLPAKAVVQGPKGTTVTYGERQSELDKQRHLDRLDEIKARGSFGRAAAVFEAEKLDEWEGKAAEARASGDESEAQRYDEMVKNLKTIKKIPEGTGEPKFFTDSQTGRRFIQFPGYAPKELKDESDTYQAKAILHDYYKASDAYWELRQYKSTKPEDLFPIMEEMTAKRAQLNKFFGPKQSGATTGGAPAVKAARLPLQLINRLISRLVDRLAALVFCLILRLGNSNQ